MTAVRWSRAALVSLLLLFGSRSARAQFTILTVGAPPAAMNISTATAGSGTFSTTGTSTYFVKAKNPAGSQKITGQLNALMPANTTLTLQLGTPPSAISMGTVTLDTTPRDLMISIDKENGNTYSLTYTFAANIAAGIIPSQTRVVTLTLMSYP